jgi:hypothetical protein
MASKLVCFSLGENKFDNKPSQRYAENFDAFEHAITTNRSKSKGELYFCAGMREGSHPNSRRYPIQANYRLASLAQSRRFICFDHDSYESPEIFRMLMNDLGAYRGFAYSTWSSTPETPRARIVLEIDREVDRVEGIALCETFDQMLLAIYGAAAIKTDPSVYRAEQPCYSPGRGAELYRFTGKTLCTDKLREPKQLTK